MRTRWIWLAAALMACAGEPTSGDDDHETSPETTILLAPPAQTPERSARLTFRCDQAECTFECALDGASFTPCTSPLRVRGLAVSAHAVEVRAVAAAGTDATPASASWEVVSGRWQAVRLGERGAVAIAGDGTLWAWGAPWLTPETGDEVLRPMQLDADTDWFDAAMSNANLCGLREPGSLSCLGVLLGPFESLHTLERLDAGEDWEQAATLGFASCARTGAGELWCRGMGSIVGRSYDEETDGLELLGDRRWLDVGASTYAACGIDEARGLYCWGQVGGTIGDTDASQVLAPLRLGTDGGWVEVAVGQRDINHWLAACALRDDGQRGCFGWGASGHGEDAVDLRAPDSARMDGPWRSLSSRCGVAEDGGLWCWGPNDHQQAGSPETLPRKVHEPVRVDTEGRFVAVASNDDASCALREDGELLCWGSRVSGQLGDGRSTMEPVPVTVAGTWSHVYAGDARTCAIRGDGRALCWGEGTLEDFWRRVQSPEVVGDRTDWAAIDGYSTTCALDTSGALFCWGALEDGVSVPEGPFALGGERRFRGLAHGMYHACALDVSDGHAWCWGRNWDGQIGDGLSGSDYREPTAVAADHAWLAIAPGYAHTCALREDHRVECWGSNEDGRLGDGSGADSATPVEVALEEELVGLVSGFPTTCGWTADGRVWCWGSTDEDESAPALLDTPHRFTEVVATDFYACGLRDDGRALCWSMFTRVMPDEPVSDEMFRELSAGFDHACGITLDDRLLCWGDNTKGQLGTGQAWVVTPVPVIP